MKKALLLLVLSSFTMVASATIFRAAASGNWTTLSTWTPAGIPSNRDTVIIGGLYTITVTGPATCQELTVTGTLGTLTINAGATLTVTANATELVDDLLDITAINVLGTLSIGGNMIMSYAEAVAATSSNTFTIGSATASGTLNVAGNLQFTAASSLAILGIRNNMRFYQGTINVLGDISFTASGNGANIQALQVNDDNTFDNKVKVINLSKNVINSSSGAISLTDANGTASYTFRYVGTTAQTLATTNIVYRHIDIANTSSEVILLANLVNANLLGNLKIKNGGVLNTKAFIISCNRYAGQIAIENGGILRVENKDGVPAQKVSGSYVCVAATSSIVDYYAPTAATSLDICDQVFTYGIIRLSGPGIKLMNSQDIDNASTFVNQIELTAGTFSITRTKKLKLTNTLTKTLFVNSGTTVLINGDFSQLDCNFTIDYNSLFSYVENGTQQIYSFKNSTGAVEPYGSLTMQRASGITITNRTVNANDVIKVRGKLTLGGNIKLNLNQSSTLELMSDASYTGYIGEIPASSDIFYFGTPAGKVVAKKYIGLTDANYRDFASPILSRTLDTWQNAGMYMTGFTGSLYPDFPFVSSYQYDETNTLTLNDGFISATNITNPLTVINGSGKVTRSGWRIYTGASAGQVYTLSDTGTVKTGSQIYTLSFTHGTGNRTTDDGWNFLGNPYPSAISWSAIYNDAENAASIGANGIKPTVYVWRPNDTGTPYDEEDSYGFYNAVTGVSSFLSATIPSNQAFWLKTYHATSNAITYDLKIKESHKVNLAASTFYKAEEGEVNKTLVMVSLQQGDLKDDVWFHTYQGATTGIDELYDVERFGEIYDGPNINFSAANTSLNLWVNALPLSGKQITMPIQVYIPANGEFTLSFSNILGFNQSYGCVRLLDQLTGTIYSISEDVTLTFTGTEGYRNERFIIIADKNLSSSITTADATCFGNEDGVLALDLSDYEDISNFTLLKDGAIYKTYTGMVEKINENLGKGTYQLINNAGLIDCAVNTFDFTVNSYPEVVATFESPVEWREDSFVPLHNSSVGATNYIWKFSDVNATSTDKTPNYIFEEAGAYTITLVSVNEFGCESVEQKSDITILSTTGIQDIAKSGIVVRSTADGLMVNVPAGEECKISLYTVDGKLAYQSRSISGNETILLARKNMIYLVKAESGKGTFTTKIIH